MIDVVVYGNFVIVKRDCKKKICDWCGIFWFFEVSWFELVLIIVISIMNLLVFGWNLRVRLFILKFLGSIFKSFDCILFLNCVFNCGN